MFRPAEKDLASYDLSELDRRFRGPLMQFFVRRLGDRAEAEDLTQQVFVRLLGRGAPEAQAPLVFRIAANLVKDRARSAVSRASVAALPETATPERLALAACELTPERVLGAREELAQILAVLDGLGPRTKDIFILFRLEKMSQGEIAARLGISRSSVEKHVMKAMHHLLAARREA